MDGSKVNAGGMTQLVERAPVMRRVEPGGTSVLRMDPLTERMNDRNGGPEKMLARGPAKAEENNGNPKKMLAAGPATVKDWVKGRTMYEKREVRNEGGERSEHLFVKPMPPLVKVNDSEGFRKVHGMPDCCGPHEVKLTVMEARAEVKELFVVENMVEANGSNLAGKQFYTLNGNGVTFVPVELDRLKAEMTIGEKRMREMTARTPSILFVKDGPYFETTATAPDVYGNSGSKVIY